jgi:DNA repair exonuclease SbcCD nuclease subunit
MTTIIHTADVHLDRAFSGLGMMSGIAAARREELRDAIRRVVDVTIEVGADALTIGGDLYEHDRATLDTGNFLAQQFARLEAVPVLISPGNHDPYMPDSLYRRVDWPSNVTIFSATQLQPVRLPGGVTVWGAAHDGPEVRRNLLAGFRVSGAGPHLLLFHGSNMSGAPEKRTGHAPFLPEDIAATGADFAMLGHYHSGRVYKSGKPLFAYPGTPEALDFSEEGEHFVLRLDIDGATVDPQPVPFGRVRYRTSRIDVTELVTSDEVRARIVELEAPLIQRVILEGRLSRDVDLDTSALYNVCAERFTYLDLVDRTEPGYDLEELADESTTKGTFVRLIQERAASGEGDRELLELAMRYGLQAFDGQEIRSL